MSYSVKEIWKDIPNYEGYYQVSNLGRVKSLSRIVNRKSNKAKTLGVKERILKPTSCTGYFRVGLMKNCKMKSTLVHRLIAELFIPNPKNYSSVNHKNGIKTDNRIENLEWCSLSHNTKHSYDIGLQDAKIGSSNGMAKLNKYEAYYIKYLLDNLKSNEVAKIFNVSRSTVNSIRYNKNWKHL